MTVLSEIAEAKMKVQTLNATPCTDCRHPFASHSIAHATEFALRNPTLRGVCRGEFLGPSCDCKGWAE